MTRGQSQPPELGSYLLALRLAAESLRESDSIDDRQERTIHAIANRAELRSRAGDGDPPPDAELIDEIASRLHAELDATTSHQVMAAIRRQLGVELEEPEAATGERETVEIEPEKTRVTDSPEDAGDMLASNRTILLTMAVLLVVGGAIALSFGVWRQGGDEGRYAFVCIPIIFCIAGYIASRPLHLPRTGQALLTIALFLIPPVAVVSSSAPVWHAWALFVVISILAATTTRLALHTGGRLVAIGIIMFAGVTIFHPFVYRTFDFGAVYVLAAMHALVVGFDFVQRLKRYRLGHPPQAAVVLRTMGILTFAVIFAILWVLLHNTRSMREELEILAPAVLLISAPGFFNGAFLFLRSSTGSQGRFAGALVAFASLVSSLLSLVLTLLEGWPLLSWSIIVTPLCILAAVVFRVRWAHLGAAIGFTILYVTAIFLYEAPPGIAYPWGALPLDEFAVRCLPLGYIFALVAVILDWRGIPENVVYARVSVVVITLLSVLSLSMSQFGVEGATVCAGFTPALLLLGAWRKERAIVAAGAVLAYLASTAAVHAHDLPAPWYGLGCGAIAFASVCASHVLERLPHLHKSLLHTGILGAIVGVALAVGTLELSVLHSFTGACASIALAMGGMRVTRWFFVRLGFAVLYATLLEATMRGFGVHDLDGLRNALEPRILLSVSALVLLVGSAFGGVGRLAILATCARQVTLGFAACLGVTVLDAGAPECSSLSGLLAATLFAAAGIVLRRSWPWRPATVLLLAGVVELVLSRLQEPQSAYDRAHVALVVLATGALVLRLITWATTRAAESADDGLIARSLQEVARTSGTVLGAVVLLIAIAFFTVASQLVKETDLVIESLTRNSILWAAIAAACGLIVPRRLGPGLQRGALVIAAVYFLVMWLGVFGFVGSGLLTYWQVAASGLSAVMAFVVGVRLPGVVPVALVTVAPALVFAFVPPMNLNPMSSLAVLVAGLIYLKGAATIESQFIYYLGTMTTTVGVLLTVHELLPDELVPPARPVVIAATATMLAVWWTYCSTRGWVRPLRFVRAALDSGVLCSALAAVALVWYLASLVQMLMAEPPIPVRSIPIPIRLAAIGVALSLVAYYVGAAAAFKSTFMVYVAELAFFGAATLLRFGFRDLFKDEVLRQALPYLIIGLGFVFAGISEFLARRGLEMFSRPLGNTGIFLPLISLLAMWFAMTAPDFDLDRQTPLVIGAAMALYFTASILRRNRSLTLAMAVFFNLAVWFVCDQFELSLRELPQLLAVPVGLSIVLAAQVNEDRLPPRIIGSLRYLGILVIYLSSAFKVFEEATAQHAIIMVICSVAGVIAGLLLHIRAYVYMGIIFLVMTILAKVVHSVVDTEAIRWGIFVIVLGLALFVPVAWREHATVRQERIDSENDGDEGEEPAEGLDLL